MPSDWNGSYMNSKDHVTSSIYATSGLQVLFNWNHEMETLWRALMKRASLFGNATTTYAGAGTISSLDRRLHRLNKNWSNCLHRWVK